MSNTKTADAKGRITLGNKYAGQTFIVLEVNDEVILSPAVTIPAREAWLYKNEAAMESLQRGLDQAKKTQFSDSPPKLDADKRMIAKIDD
ncbi:MAG TPA: hypothetical protein VFG04_24235 [Planctomycetaceae bacterium]|jgi:hypothetical protein|nr:hypothetical protein [Planctomycetaceae bacterium]